jgi:hypothetical protein
VEYISDWFQQATWNNIQTHGRVMGRPSLRNVRFLRQTATSLMEEKNGNWYYDKYDAAIAGFTYGQLVLIWRRFRPLGQPHDLAMHGALGTQANQDTLYRNLLAARRAARRARKRELYEIERRRRMTLR